MAEQLVLLEPEGDDFRLDERTRELGRRGLAEARRVLAEKAKAKSVAGRPAHAA
jgi:hypothetical protein